VLAFYADSFGLIELGRPAAGEYGRLRAATEALGRPVSSNDLWIAASATANGLPLVTLNRRHFEPLTLHGLRLL
jgi:predicted nucleic acid-binding protein